MGKIVILGGGESGYGAAVLASRKGHQVFVSDNGQIAEKYRTALQKENIPFEEGGHTDEILASASFVVKSPGIPDTAPVVRWLGSKDIPVISEIEFAGRYMDGSKTICVTGSNGKTTTATLIHHILSAAGYDVALAGNVGASLAYEVATRPREWYVVEISSFQLDGMAEFKADIAVLTNITADHLDRYEYRIEKYIDSKMGIVRNQSYDDYFIYCLDDQNTREAVANRELPMRLLPLGTHIREERYFEKGHTHARWQGAHVEAGSIIAEVEGRRFAVPADGLMIKGKHNLYNAMAATLAAMAAGVDDEPLRDGLSSFEGIEHRLEPVGEVDGVEYINDSKATNTDSAWYALDSMEKPAVWIAGGTDKGNDYSTLAGLAREKVKALVCLGVDNGKLVESFKDVVPIIRQARSMEEALSAARELAAEGDAVLLSPACASFDLFENYQDRGRQFKEHVKKMGK